MQKILTPICPTCNCSLIRLGIGSDRWTKLIYEDKEYFFCCQACVDLFNQKPSRYLKEIENLVVCPTCLAEKPLQQTVRMEIAGWEVFFVDVPIVLRCFKRNQIIMSNVCRTNPKKINETL